MKTKNKVKIQNGNALVISLILISVAAVVTMTSMRGSLLQEKMTANQNLKAIAFTSAESGASQLTQWLRNPTTTWYSTTWQNIVPSTMSGNPNNGSMGYYWVLPSDVDWNWYQVSMKVSGLARANDAAPGVAKSTLKITVSRPTTSTNLAFGAGLISNNNVDINGNANVTGSIFANGNIDISGGNNTLTDGIVSAQGSVAMAGVSPDYLNPGADIATVPVVTDAWLAQMQAAAAVQICNIVLVGDQLARIYYCEGDATVSGIFSNATIVATGNVTKSGGGQTGGLGKSSSAVTVAVVAKGDITFNGSSDDNAVFWSNGTYTHNGSGTVRGTIIAGGDITRNGTFNFQQIEAMQNTSLPPTVAQPSRVLGWQEILE